MDSNTFGTIRFRSRDAFAVYSMPGTTSHTLVYGNEKRWRENYKGPAFYVQSFDHHKGPPVAIPADNILENVPFHCDVRLRTEQRSTEKSYYLGVAREAIDAIRANEFTKIVLSKVKVVPRRRGKIYDLFIDLKNRYPKAFVFLYHIPGRGYWCGATPEVLLRDSRKGYHTMALAATQADRGLPLSEIFWGSKEQHEQHVIETFVEGRLEDAFISYRKRGPVTVKAGNVLHIKTDYYMDKNVDIWELVSRLHPGPAICGLPQSLSQEWIRSHESHDREDYCGFCGPWGIHNDRALFINLRSMSIWKNAYVLYLGGGLTAQSDANDEWNETELKAQTLLGAIEQTQEV